MATGEQSGKRKSDKKAPGEKSQLIVTQINFCREQLVGFKTAYEIRKQLAERWGLPERTADDRIKAAREAIKNDISVIDRQELASMLMDMAETMATCAQWQLDVQDDMTQCQEAMGSYTLGSGCPALRGRP